MTIAALVGIATVAIMAAGALAAPIIDLAIKNLIAYLIVLPIKWGIEAVHKFVHRKD